jgi:hypothetical protein
MKKLKLYIETSVWNFLFADDASNRIVADCDRDTASIAAGSDDTPARDVEAMCGR